jgi:hypothetical protein
MMVSPDAKQRSAAAAEHALSAIHLGRAEILTQGLFLQMDGGVSAELQISQANTKWTHCGYKFDVAERCAASFAAAPLAVFGAAAAFVMTGGTAAAVAAGATAAGEVTVLGATAAAAGALAVAGGSTLAGAELYHQAQQH